MTDNNVAAVQRREDAQRAKDELNNAVLHDSELKIGWGKTVVLPQVALYTPAGTAQPMLGQAPQGLPVPGWGTAPQQMPPQAGKHCCASVTFLTPKIKSPAHIAQPMLGQPPQGLPVPGWGNAPPQMPPQAGKPTSDVSGRSSKHDSGRHHLGVLGQPPQGLRGSAWGNAHQQMPPQAGKLLAYGKQKVVPHCLETAVAKSTSPGVGQCTVADAPAAGELLAYGMLRSSGQNLAAGLCTAHGEAALAKSAGPSGNAPQ